MFLYIYSWYNNYIRDKESQMEFWEVSSQEFFDQFDPQAEDWATDDDTEVFTPEVEE
jgi:hypothetical protein